MRRFPDDFGPVLYAKDLADIFNISLSRVYAKASTAEFDLFVNRPATSRKTWSRDRLVKYLAGELKGLTESRLKLVAS